MLQEITPYEAWEGKKPSVDRLKVFGCVAYHLKAPNQIQSKFDSKGNKCIMLGYSSIGNYRLYSLETQEIIVTKDARFHENTFVTEHATLPTIEEEDESHDNEIIISLSKPSPVLETTNEENLSSNLRRSQRTKQPNSRLADFITEEDEQANIMQEKISDDPKTLKEAYSRSDADLWQAAVKEELDSLIKNETWELVDLPKGKSLVQSLWVLTVKRNAQREVIKYKARCVANGHSQRKGEDFSETFSPVAKMTSIRILLALAAQKNLEVWHLDVKTAYLNGVLQEEVYLKPPQDLEVPPGKYAN